MGGIGMPRSTCLVVPSLPLTSSLHRRVTAVDQPALRRLEAHDGSIPARRPRAVTPIPGSGSAGRARAQIPEQHAEQEAEDDQEDPGDRRGAVEREGEAADDGGHRQDREEPHALTTTGVHELDAAHPGGLGSLALGVRLHGIRPA